LKESIVNYVSYKRSNETVDIETSTTKMAGERENEPLLLSNDDAMENVRRRVQKRIAGKYLEAIAPGEFKIKCVNTI